MAEAASEIRTPPSWMYVNEVRLITVVLGAAIAVLALGMSLYLVAGTEHLDTVDVLLGTGVFFLLFTLLLFVPRLRSRGAMSFTLVIGHSVDEAEIEVVAAIEETGRKANVERLASRFRHPPRVIRVDGLTWRFSLHTAHYRENRYDGIEWTEIVQAGLENEEDEVARDLRDRVLGRLTTPGG